MKNGGELRNSSDKEGIFLKYHLIVCITLLLYLLFSAMVKSENLTLPALCISFVVIFLYFSDWLIVRHHLLKRERFFLLMLRMTELISLSLSLLIFQNLLYIELFFFAFYWTTGMEFVSFFDLAEADEKVFSYVMAVLPFILAMVVLLIKDISRVGLTGINIFVIGIGVLTSVWTVHRYMSNCIREFDKWILERNRSIEKAVEDNEKLQQYQKKMSHFNEQLSIQKFKLEYANAEITQTNKMITMQNLLMKQIMSSLDIKAILHTLVNSLYDIPDMDICCIAIKDPQKSGDCLCEVKTKLREEDTRLLEQYLKKGYAFKDFSGLREIRQDDAVNIKEYRFLQPCWKIKSMLICPLIEEDEMIGIWILASPKRNFFHSKTDSYEVVSGQFKIALRHASLYAQVEEMALKDGLTGIYNRRYLSELLENMRNMPENYNGTVSAVLFDIDHFKNINDTYGHLFGDQVIAGCSKVLKKISAEYNGLPVRYGGEEFITVFMDKKLVETYEIVKELQRAIKEQIFYYNSIEIQIDVSFGLSNYPETCLSLEELVEHADNAMYLSKQNGRGRITIDNTRETV